MNPISSQDVSALADAVRRRHRAFGASPEALASLDEHLYRVTTLVEDISEGESLNTIEYALLRTSAILHDAAAAKTTSPEASAELAREMLAAVGADPAFADAAAVAIRRHAGTRYSNDAALLPQNHAEHLLHDVCLLAKIVESRDEAAQRALAASLYSPSAVRMAAEMIDARTAASPV